ncbi:MAG TPA: molybdopterin-dependent oxidoreductase [Streptosporangiaceae bacterium]
MQHPGPVQWPSRPVGLYRVTQGVHVVTGVAVLPLLLGKLWTVYPRFWAGIREMREGMPRPGARLRDVREFARTAGGRGLLIPLTAGAIFQVFTGLTNIAYWYPWPFFFTTAHYWTAYIVVGALVVHVLNEWATARRALTPLRHAPPATGGTDRRGFLTAIGVASGVIVLATAGETLVPLRRLALLAPRAPGAGQRGVPVNRSAAAAGVTAPAAYRLRVRGDVRHRAEWTLAELAALPQHTVALPIACVEGWSVSAHWTGVRLRDLLRAAGVAEDANVRVESMERGGRYRASEVAPPHWHDPLTLLALRCDGEVLHLDHGYPLRLIAPDRPGVLQTKWVNELIVHGGAS